MFKKLWSWFKVHVLRIPAGAWAEDVVHTDEPVEGLPWALPVDEEKINPFTRPFRKVYEGELIQEAYALVKSIHARQSILVEFNEAGEGRLRLVPNGWERGDGDIVIDHRHSTYQRLPSDEPGYMQISAPMRNAMVTGNYPTSIDPKDLPAVPATRHTNQTTARK